MMAAYQPQQPGMHPGIPHGHPGMAPTPGQHMGQPMMHPGAQQHVTQASAMMAMQPGASGMGGAVMAGAQHPGAAAVMGIPGQPGQPGQGMNAQAISQAMAAQAMSGQAMAGGGPNGHAMSSMTPQQIMQQQQLLQQQMQNHPQLAIQQHQALMRQRQMQQAQANGMMNMHSGMQGMNPTQMAQFQQANAAIGGVPLPPHLAQAQLQLRAQQQQQHQQQQAAQHQQAQQAQQAQLAQMVMQQANSQQSNPGQSVPMNQPPNPTHPQQMRPQSRMSNANEQNVAVAQQVPQQSQPQQVPPQVPQQVQQPTTSAQVQNPAASVAAQQAQKAQTQPQASAPHPANQSQPQMGGMPPNAQAAALQAQANQQAQQIPNASTQQAIIQQQQLQNATVQRRIMQQRMEMQRAGLQQGSSMQPAQGGQYILRVMLLGNELSAFSATTGRDMSHWSDFVDKHFAQEGRLLHRFDDGDPGSKSKTYEVLRPTIARYFWTYFDSGAISLRLHTENARETPVGNRMQVSCSHAVLTVSYPSGARLEMIGCLNALFAPSSNIIECLEIQQTSTEEVVSRSEIERVLNTYSPSLPSKQSPKMTKSKLPKAQQKLQQYEGLTIDNFPKVPKGSMGVISRVQQFLEIGETMNVMSDLMSFANEQKLRPEIALDALVNHYETQPMMNGATNPQLNLPMNGMSVPQRGPNMQGMQGMQGMQNMPMMGQATYASPSMSNLNLPMQNGMNGSPHITQNSGLHANTGVPANSHTPSPHQSNMAAPLMMPQHSQQGTNSSVGSTNTSPNVNNKRRRSTVKLEEDGVGQGGDGANGNQNRVKPSPRMNKKSKPGG